MVILRMSFWTFHVFQLVYDTPCICLYTCTMHVFVGIYTFNYYFVVWFIFLDQSEWFLFLFSHFLWVISGTDGNKINGMKVLIISTRNKSTSHEILNTEYVYMYVCTEHYTLVTLLTYSAICFFFSFSSLIRKGSLTSCEEELREVGNCLFS